MRRLTLIVALALAATHARGDEAPNVSVSRRAESRSKWQGVWPRVTIAAGTNATAQGRVGVEFVHGLPSPKWNLGIAPEAAVDLTNGTASLAQLSKGKVTGTTKWTAGLSLTLMQDADDIDRPLVTKNPSPARAAARSVCFAACRGDNPTLDERQFCGAIGDTNVDTIAESLFCQRGQKLLATLKQKGVAPTDRFHVGQALCRQNAGCDEPAGNTTPKWSIQCQDIDAADLCEEARSLPDANTTHIPSGFSRLLVSAGARVGANHFDYYASDASMNLTAQSDAKYDWALAASLTWVHAQSGLTLEIPLFYESAWSASTKPLHFCTPQGQVAREGGSDAAEKCTDAVVGSPTDRRHLYGALFLGYLDVHAQKDKDRGIIPSTFFRVAVGPSLDYELVASGANVATLNLEAPIYIDFANAPSGFDATKNFRGLVRLTPSVGATNLGGSWSPVAQISLAVLTDYTLFRRALDWR